MSQYHIAQINIARLIAPIEDPLIADFVAALAPVNALADAAPGFVWRFQTDTGDATGYRAYGDDRIIVNFSVWESVEALKSFVYKGDHSNVMRKRKQWFEKMAEQYTALWWVPAGHIPTWSEAQERLESLRQNGDTPYAFSLRKVFPPQPVQV